MSLLRLRVNSLLLSGRRELVLLVLLRGLFCPDSRLPEAKAQAEAQANSFLFLISRIVRDYDQYISRQFKRGASRQELNVSWLKKNELEVKRHVVELRDNIRTNWTQTGQELGRELRQIWQNSRPGSPAPSNRNSIDYGSARGPLASPTGGSKSHLSRVEALNRPESPGVGGRNEDFATGYSLGLIGGVRAWVSVDR